MTTTKREYGNKTVITHSVIGIKTGEITIPKLADSKNLKWLSEQIGKNFGETKGAK